MNAEIVIDARGLTKRYDGRVVVDHLDMQVARGRIHGFLGPNGSGKTTTIRMLCGLLTPDEGGGTCLGHDIRTRRRDQARGRLHDAEVRPVRGPVDRENLDFVAASTPWRTGAIKSAPRWTGSAWPPAAPSWPARCRAAGSSAWRWPPA
jgi:ABC-type transport system involved in cytochrome c biogenesis ATPase subunit